MSAEFLGPVNRGRRVPRLNSRVRTAESEWHRGCCSEMRLCHAGHQRGRDEQRGHDRFDDERNPQRLPAPVASRSFVTGSPSTKHRLRTVSVVACSGSLLPCMDAPHSGGTPSGRGGVAIRRDSEERALAQLDTEAWPKFPLARLRNETSAARDANHPLSHSIIVSYSDPKLMCTTLPISCISWILLPSYWSGRGEIVMSLHSKEAVGVRYT